MFLPTTDCYRGVIERAVVDYRLTLIVRHTNAYFTSADAAMTIISCEADMIDATIGQMRVMAVTTGSPSGAVMPSTVTGPNLWVTGQMLLRLCVAAVQTGGRIRTVFLSPFDAG